MRGMLLVTVIALALPAAATAAPAGSHEHLLPDRRDDRLERSRSYVAAGGWRVAPASVPAGGGTRVAAIVEVADAGPALMIEARGVSSGRAGPWLRLEETYRAAGQRIGVADLGALWPGAEIRIAAADDRRAGDLAWELLVPRYPDAGREARALAGSGVHDPPEGRLSEGRLFAVDPALSLVGVISREEWGARPTQCTLKEESWYRMAIHHTAGGQTSGGTVEGAVRGLQAYSQDSGRFCDIPYQYLVGHDGSLWEGRPIELVSGATGGGQNQGNLAVSFLGCYHPSGCPGGVSHPETEEMIAAARLLVQTLVRIHGIQTTEADIRGHRDWPGNSTACPGQFVYERLGELRADLAWFAATETGRSFPVGDAALPIRVGEPAEVWVELENTGGFPWERGQVFLGTTGPRDHESPLFDPSWAAPNRAATVAERVEPGAVGRFGFHVRADAAGAYEQSFGLVSDGITWFADAPWGGGPGDEAVILRVSAGGGADAGGRGLFGGCALADSAAGAGHLPVLLALLLAANRRRRPAQKVVPSSSE